MFAALVVISANAGGAWSPIGDVTTTMLWIGGQITAYSIIMQTILPSLVSMIIPAALISWQMKGNIKPPAAIYGHLVWSRRNVDYYRINSQRKGRT